MRYAVLGAGGVGGLLAGALARAGSDVLLLVRPERLADSDGRLVVESRVLGDFEVVVSVGCALDREVDVLWVATKATSLEAALAVAPPEAVGDATVIPLLNGVDHVRLLRARYRSVVGGAIRVESERTGAGRIRQTSPFIRIELAGAEYVSEDLRAAGIDSRIRPDELGLLWDKLVFLAPVALATTALDGSLGEVRGDPRYLGCQAEALAVARAEGAAVDEAALRSLQEAAPAEMRSSMQKDVAAARPPELDAIAGPILRGGARHRIDVPATTALAQLVASRAAPSGS